MYLQSVEYYLAIKMNDILSFGTAWADLEDIMLIEMCQAKKRNAIWFHLYVESKKQNKWKNRTETDS